MPGGRHNVLSGADDNFTAGLMLDAPETIWEKTLTWTKEGNPGCDPAFN
jgi:hypothetical protein